MKLQTLRNTALAVGLLVCLPLSTSLAYPLTAYLKIGDIDGESVRESTESIDRLYNELTHIVQQRSGATRHEAAHTIQQRNGKPGAEIASIADQIMAESHKLQKLYKTPEVRDGKKHAQAIGNDARTIRQLAKQLNAAKSAEQEAEVYARISERLRHKNRAVEGHKDWINLMSVSQSGDTAGSQASDPDGQDRIKVRLPANSGSSQGKNIRKNMSVIANKRDSSGGDPDRPVIIGTAPNPQGTEDDDTSTQGGKVETTWKIEKGEK